MLCFFLSPLRSEARTWLDKEPPRSILTWDDLVSKFINQFFPPSKTTYLRNEITTFYQKPNETFNEAWERFKGLLRQCPHHGFSELHQLDTFYNSLNTNDQDALDSAAGGNFLDKKRCRGPREGLPSIENSLFTGGLSASIYLEFSSGKRGRSFKPEHHSLPPPEPPDECLNFEPILVMKNVVLKEDFYQNKKTLPLNIEDVNSFTFLIWTFLPYFTYTEESPLIFSFRRLNQQFLKPLVSGVVSRFTQASHPLCEISLGRSDILSSLSINVYLCIPHKRLRFS
ncbi:reverse transcriptase domain-containing protein [Tanacetum coccineum]